MAIKKYKPTSNGRHDMTGSDFTEIITPVPERSLLQPLRSHARRNNNGRIIVRYQGGGHERRCRVINFKRNRDSVVAATQTIGYDPNRSANIALVRYENGVKAYVLAPKGLEMSMRLVSGPEADIKVGSTLPLENIPVDTVIHGIEMKPGKDGQLIRSAGTGTRILGKEGKYVLVRLNSDGVRMILAACRATIGSVGNEQRELINIGKAGRSRWMRECPTVRGSVMNPNGHPHGSGGGKTPIGRKAPVSPWDQLALGYKTRNKKAKSDKLIVRRRKDK